MNQLHFFGDDNEKRDTSAEPPPGKVAVITSEAEVRELAREYFNLPGAEPPLLRAKREQAARDSGAHRRGLVAKWAPYETARGHISIHDPGSGEWYDVQYKDVSGWAQREARRRAELYKNGNRHAYELNSAQMHEIWQEEHPPESDYIVEEHPLDNDA